MLDLWPRTTGPKGDLVDDEMNRVLQVPGWSNIFTQPIINRIEMLSTGVRTDIGVKVFGPNLDTIDRVSKQIETALKPLHGTRDALAAPVMGQGHLLIDIDRQAAARYGISVEDIQNEIEVALAGRVVTYTVEKPERFPVRIRYARVDRGDEEAIGKLLISPSSMSSPASGMSAGGMGGRASSGAMSAKPARGEANSMLSPTTSLGDTHGATPQHALTGKKRIPLSAVANIQIVEGPAMIKSENGRLLNDVTLNVRNRDIVGFVDEAQRVVAEKVGSPPSVLKIDFRKKVSREGAKEHRQRRCLSLRLRAFA